MAHWVRIENVPQGDKTGCIDMDLDRVRMVQVGRESGRAEKAGVHYGDTDKVMVLDGEAARVFLSEWGSYRKENGGFAFQAPEASPGRIINPTKGLVSPHIN